MSLSDYPAELPGSPCGSSWGQTLLVTGEIVPIKYGSQIFTTLPALVSPGVPSLGHDGDGERALLEHLSQEAVKYERLVSVSKVLTPAQKTSVLWLIDSAIARIAAVAKSYRDGTESTKPIELWVLGTLTHLRCAQYQYTKITLVHKAWEQYQKEHTPIAPVGGLTSDDPDSDNELPTPEPVGPMPLQFVPRLPVPKPEPDDPDAASDDAPDGTGAPDVTVPSEQQRSLNTLGLAVGGIALGALLWKVLK
jgi:hypothetical protein